MERECEKVNKIKQDENNKYEFIYFFYLKKKPQAFL